MGRTGFQSVVNDTVAKTRHFRSLLESVPSLEVLDTDDLNIVPVRLRPGSRAAAHQRRTLAAHGIRAEFLSRNQNDCPLETFPLYVMPHLSTDDLAKFAESLNRPIA